MLLYKRPVLCNYYVTYRCNAACGFCDIWERPSPYVTMEHVRANLRDLKKLGVKVIDFTGGEPLLHRELHLMLAEAKALGFITTVTTNCLLYPKRAQQLAGLIDMLHFSLDAATAEAHNASRRVDCFGHFLQSIEIAKELGERPDILFTVTRQSLSDIEAVYQNYALPNSLVLILNPVFEYNQLGSQEALNARELRQLRQWASKPLVYLNEAFLTLREKGGNDINDPVCKAATTTLVIDPENRLLLPCYHLGKDAFPINNQLHQLYTSQAVQALRHEEGRLPQCQGCTINCYMQPSFSVNFNRYFLEALPSTFKYNLMKGTALSLLRKPKARPHVLSAVKDA